MEPLCIPRRGDAVFICRHLADEEPTAGVRLFFFHYDPPLESRATETDELITSAPWVCICQVCRQLGGKPEDHICAQRTLNMDIEISPNTERPAN